MIVAGRSVYAGRFGLASGPGRPLAVAADKLGKWGIRPADILADMGWQGIDQASDAGTSAHDAPTVRIMADAIDEQMGKGHRGLRRIVTGGMVAQRC